MGYIDHDRQLMEMQRANQRHAGKPVKEAQASIKVRSPRAVIVAAEATINDVRADEACDSVTRGRLTLEALKVIQTVLASNIDAKIDALARRQNTELAELRRVATAEAKRQPALPNGTGNGGKLLPLIGADDVIEAQFMPEKRPRGRPRKIVPVAVTPMPSADAFTAALEEFIGQDAGDA